MNKELSESVSLIVTALLTAFFGAVIGGTIIFIVWDNVVPFVFPSLVSAGYLVADLTWFQAVGLSWIFNILFRNIDTNKSK